jgi:hypothetical protein
MQLAICHPGTRAVWADALFASVLQRSDDPGAGQARKAIAAAVRAYGGPGCAQRVAQEFGDHPEAAADRMRWARAVAGELSAAPPAPARQGRRRQPGPPAGRPAGMAAGRVMRRIRAGRAGIRRDRARAEDPPAGPRDPDVVRAKARARARPAGSSRAGQAQQADASSPGAGA